MLYSVAFIVILAYLIYQWRYSGKEPIDISENADYYINKYDLLVDDEELEVEYREPNQTNIQINITHNHLHIHPTTEGSHHQKP